jgi:hypothetical protein
MPFSSFSGNGKRDSTRSSDLFIIRCMTYFVSNSHSYPCLVECKINLKFEI